MTEAFDASTVVVETTPLAVKGDRVGCNWTPDRCLSSLDLHFDFYDKDPADGGVKVGEGRMEISDGTISHAIKKTWEKLQAIATAAGINVTMPDPDNAEGPEIANPDWPVAPDAQTIWTAGKNLVGDGTGLTAATIASFVFKKKWGQWMLRREWRKIAVKAE